MRQLALAGLIALWGCSRAPQTSGGEVSSRFQRVNDLAVLPSESQLVHPMLNVPGPLYPLSALKKREGGRVIAAFVIDTTGHVEMQTVSWVAAAPGTNREFFGSVCRFLAKQRFEFTGVPRRVLALNPFEFNVANAAGASATSGSDQRERGAVKEIETASAEDAVRILNPLPHCTG